MQTVIDTNNIEYRVDRILQGYAARRQQVAPNHSVLYLTPINEAGSHKIAKTIPEYLVPNWLDHQIKVRVSE